MADEKRLIDANALIKYISERTAVTYPNLYPGLFKAIGYIRKFETVDAVEVVHGRWEKHLAPYTNSYWSCTQCNGNFMTDAAQYWHYCPNCGAKMDE